MTLSPFFQNEPLLAPLPSPAASPEATMIWNEVVGPKYAGYEDVLVAAATAHSDATWSQLPEFAGARVADVGCGFADTAHRLAQTAKEVVGVDCAEALLARGQARYAARANLRLELADVGDFHPEQPLDLLYSRFGLMFFERPVATLRHLRSWLRPGGQLCALVWRRRADNPWLELARDVLLQYVAPVDDGAPSCGPGPFSMADAETTTAMLEAAGFSDVVLQRVDAQISVGQSADEAAEFQLALGPGGELARHAEARGDEGLAPARRALVERLARYQAADGVRMQSSSWWISARA